MKPKCKTYPDGTQAWYLNSVLHKEDGPAYIGSDGSQYWFLNGKLHREDGPAAIYQYGYKGWWLNGNDITDEVNNWANERKIDLNNMSDMDKLVLKIEMKMWAKQ